MKKLKMAVLMLLGGLVWCACQKGKEVTSENHVVNEPLTVEVNGWLDRSEENIRRPEAIERFNHLRQHLQLDKAWKETINRETDILVIPVDEGFSPTRNAAEHTLHCLLMRLAKDGSIQSGHLVQYIPAAKAGSTVPRGLFTSYGTGKKLPDGRIAFMTTTGNFLYESSYRDGKETSFQTIHNPRASTPTDEECVDWYLQTYENGVLVSEVYVFTTCGPYVEEGSSGGSGTGQGPLPQILNNVQDTCLHEMVDQAVSRDCQNSISRFVNNVFGQSNTFHIGFYDAHLPVIGGDAGKATCRPLQTPNNFKVTVTLNSSPGALHGASSEFVAATIFHEVLHGWIDLMGPIDPNGTIGHETMAEPANIERMALALKEMYPNMSDQDARDLAWGGLEETNAYAALSYADKTRIAMTNADYLYGNKGTPCTP